MVIDVENQSNESIPVQSQGKTKAVGTTLVNVTLAAGPMI